MNREISRRNLFHASCAAGLAALPATAAGHAERLQITKVELFKVVVPMQDDIISSPELGKDTLTEFPSIPKFIIKLHTDSGMVGIGETSRGLRDEPVRRNAEFLRGKNLFDLNLTGLGLPDQAGYQGFEMACYDAIGKALGWPVYKLLGGLAQPKVL